MGYSIHWEKGGVVKCHFGDVSSADLLGAVLDTESDPRFDSLRYVINDFRDCRSIAISPTVLEDIVVADTGASKTNPDIRIAIVAILPEVVELAKRYAAEDAHGYETRIFSAMNAARTWLGCA